MSNHSIADLIEAQDMNALLRAVDGLCERKEWDALLDLADRCEEAVERGKQLWPISQHVDYRIALEAPGEYAAGVLTHDLTRFSLGPLTEVAASTHAWEELAPHLEEPQLAAYVAQERVLRGERLTGDERAHPEVLEMPLELQPWEPTYPLAVYRSDHVEVAEVWEPKAPLGDAPVHVGDRLAEPELENSLLDLVHPWVAESNGAARSAVVEGDAVGAASALTGTRLRVGSLLPEEAVQRMAWAAASGGAHGRRRGAAFGRFLTFHTLALLGDVRWPGDLDGLGEAAASLGWYRWDEGEPEEGWVLRLAVEDRDHGWAAAVAATDLKEDEEEL